MHPFEFVRATAIENAVRDGSRERVKWIAGGTNLVDLMRVEVEAPAQVVDINGLELGSVTE